MSAHVSDFKKAVVQEYGDMIKKYSVISVVNVENLTGKQIQSMRRKLSDSVVIKMSKKRLMKIALENANSDKVGLIGLFDHMKGMPALLFSNESPFKLFKILKKNKSSAPIKAGQEAPREIVVPAGPTGFAPGPIIGELGACGIKAGIDAGKVVIKADSSVAKEGDIISDKLAQVLSRLGIEPMEIGLDLTAAYADGEILTKSVLDIDEDAYINDIVSMASQAFNVAMEIGYVCSDTIESLLQKSARDAKAVALESNYICDETIGELLTKANGQMISVSSGLPDDAKGDSLKNLAMASASVELSVSDEKPKKEEKPAADPSAGLGALFG